MAEITVADVDASGDSAWLALATAEKDRAVAQANAWLSTKHFRTWETQPGPVTAAGVELALASSEGDLYAGTATGGIKRKSVKAGPVETETEYDAGVVSEPGRLTYVKALIRPYLTSTGTTRLMDRL